MSEYSGPGLRSQYRDSLRAERSGDRFVVQANFPCPFRSAPRHIQPPVKWITGFPGVKRPGRGADHASPSMVEVKGSVELYLYSLSGPSWPVVW
jgi:hypothetical protein